MWWEKIFPHTLTFSSQNSLFHGWATNSSRYFSSVVKAIAARSLWNLLEPTVFLMTWMKGLYLKLVTPPCCVRQVRISLVIDIDSIARSSAEMTFAWSWHFRYSFFACSRWSMGMPCVVSLPLRCANSMSPCTDQLFTHHQSCVYNLEMTVFSLLLPLFVVGSPYFKPIPIS